MMTKCIFSFFSFALILLLLCSCSNHTPSAESEVKLTNSPAVSQNSGTLPTDEIPAQESEQQADMPKSTDIVIPEDNKTGGNSITTTDMVEINPMADDKTDWKTAYKSYLASYSPEMGYVTLGLVDFDGDKQPELIILDDSHGTLRGRYIIISFQNGEAVEVCQYGTSSYITEFNEQFYFYRDFDSIHDGGGMYGYGFVSRLDCSDGIFSIANLLQSSVDYNYDLTLDELSWQLRGEENIIKSSDFKNHLNIQKLENDFSWQDINADEYISLKITYIGANPSGKLITDYFKHKIDFFDDSDNTRPITQNELDEFFDRWGK